MYTNHTSTYGQVKTDQCYDASERLVRRMLRMERPQNAFGNDFRRYWEVGRRVSFGGLVADGSFNRYPPRLPILNYDRDDIGGMQKSTLSKSITCPMLTRNGLHNGFLNRYHLSFPLRNCSTEWRINHVQAI